MNSIFRISFTILTFSLSMSLTAYSSRPFKIIAPNLANRGQVTDTIKSGDFVLGINDYGGGYITEIKLPGIGNIMDVQAQRYGRGGQSSIRCLAHGGKYNPTQAGYSDNSGTECEVTKSSGKIVVEPRGCSLFNGDGAYDYTRWENIAADPYNEVANGTGAANESDVDQVEEENLSVTIDGNNYRMQEAEVYSEFDFYAEYENYRGKLGLKIPAIRHYLEYRFIRPTDTPNACMGQFSKSAMSASKNNIWAESSVTSDISSENPAGVYHGTDKDMNATVFSWSIRNDLAIWNPQYRYVQLNSGEWQIQQREKAFTGNETDYKLCYIIAESIDETTGRALGFYRPDSFLNKNNIVGVKESDGSEAYTDSRITDNFYLDSPTRTPSMSWIGFRNNSKGLINRSRLTGAYEGVYEKLRQETFLLYGTPAELKAAFLTLDAYYKTTSVAEVRDSKENSFQIYPNPATNEVKIELGKESSNIEIFNSLGVLVYSKAGDRKIVSLTTSQIGGSGMYVVRVVDDSQKLLVFN